MAVNDQAVSPMLDIMKKMEKAQEQMKPRFVEEDQMDFRWSDPNEPGKPDLSKIAGLSISSDGGEEQTAIVSLVIVAYPTFEVMYHSFLPIIFSTPAIPGYLGFREAGPFMQLLNRVMQKHPELTPELLMVHGHGKYDYGGFGLACHLGVLSGVPAVAVSHEWMAVDGLSKEQVDAHVQKGAEAVALLGTSGVLWGMAFVPPCELKSAKENVLYVSVGNKLSLDTAVELVKATCIADLPEPILKALDAGSTASQRPSEAHRQTPQNFGSPIQGLATSRTPETPQTPRTPRILENSLTPRTVDGLGSTGTSPMRPTTKAAAAARQRAAMAYVTAQKARETQQPAAKTGSTDTPVLKAERELKDVVEELQEHMANQANQRAKEKTEPPDPSENEPRASSQRWEADANPPQTTLPSSAPTASVTPTSSAPAASARSMKNAPTDPGAQKAPALQRPATPVHPGHSIRPLTPMPHSHLLPLMLQQPVRPFSPMMHPTQYQGPLGPQRMYRQPMPGPYVNPSSRYALGR
jgi:deoxyribonuclease V|uniref:Uncharacterized protein n=1 Tax=Eutreptiella gymnastica TaxID=73025 RepID=A0A7S4FQD9_9EUGL|mmetsp:Transcript_66351/g.110869  ORF Transcript_66351/g.110869 Transcript_66351/m.110869 type:complete len:523 (+) Transcript_66351:48-1616(+)|eukprot:CAMPEP_0174304114 /NCGR_PEP_ID=MMETSP0809-20121228/60584_1 /TAXON_ID=73025 ORGANISM="Eutreptiella gymnastica-like, Strain CCMP1594" /NCGR_SAMPLE_ID=MMETSP0809 /ASSEMBLY_ACC=CAM_ASM_000658 /LENGTH=522 /DNA_ID=CAMNT_0015410263 /DNA_START=47 /DNA_END=1615 /DNA_ORIENTATION=-